MLTTGQFLMHQARSTWHVSPDQTVKQALVLMSEKNIGAVLVLSQGALVGIFSERDYARKVALFGKSSDTTRVRDVMTADVITIDASQKIDKCMQVMTDRHIRHLPVLKDGQLIGVISIGDVVREMMAHQKYLIDQLESYIRG